MTHSHDLLRLSTALKPAQPAASRALEQAWQKRKQELGNWQPSGGWLSDARTLGRMAHLPR